MANKYQQPSFNFKTNIAKYECNYIEYNEGEEHWEVKVIYNSSENLTGLFNIPVTWSREMVFGWLSRMELSEV